MVAVNKNARKLACFLCLISYVGVPAFASGVTYETHVLTDTPAPDAGGAVFTGFGNPFISHDGQLGFSSILSGPGITTQNDTALYTELGGTLSLVAMEGAAAPGTGAGVVFSGFDSPIMNGSGEVAFVGFLSGAGVSSSNNSAVFADRVGPLTLIAREGDAAPGTEAGTVFRNFGRPVISESGSVAFSGPLRGPSVTGLNDSAMFVDDAGSLNIVARIGEAVPGMAPNEVFADFAPPHFDLSGQVTTLGFLRDSGNPGQSGFRTDSYGVFSASTGSIAVVVREGDPVPGIGGAAVFDRVIDPVFSGVGKSAFRGTVTGHGDPGRDEGVFSYRNGSLGAVALEGDAPPEAGPGVAFSGFGEVSMNQAGQTTFRAFLSGTCCTNNDMGLYSDGTGVLALLAADGGEAPVGEAGVLFHGFSDLMISDTGQSAFLGTLVGTGVTSANDSGLFASTLNGELTLIAREGDNFDVDQDPLTEDLRTISMVDYEASILSETQRSTSFNDDGMLAFRLEFTDGSAGVFVASLIDELAGDVDGDGFVGAADLDILLANWGQAGGGPEDLSGDGTVGDADLDIVLAHWGEGTPAGTVPEPGSLATLILLAAVSGLARRRRACPAYLPS